MPLQAKAISSGNGAAFSSATAQAFGTGSNADAYASAISEGIQQRGCGFYQQAFAQVCLPSLPTIAAGLHLIMNLSHLPIEVQI